MKRFTVCLSICLMALTLFACNTVPDSDNSGKSETTQVTTSNSNKTHTHTFGAWQVLENATCETDGTSRRSCFCGEIQEKTVSASGHKWTEVDCLTSSTCTVCNASGQEAPGHDLVNGYCNRCNTSFRTEEDVQRYIKIVNASVYKIDSAGGVSVDIGWENMYNQTVKYIYFTVTAYNAVGDPVPCTVRNEYDFRLSATGPYVSGAKAYSVSSYGQYQNGDYIWDNVWYNDTAETIRITQVIIRYMDGSEIIFDEKDTQLAFAPMSLSTTAVKIQMDMPQFTVSDSDEISKLKLGIVSDEGYFIKKQGTAHVKLTEVYNDLSGGPLDWEYGSVIYDETLTFTDECYITPYSNELTLDLLLGMEQRGLITFELELTLSFDGEDRPLTHTVKGFVRVI